jgi:hypothetical protein
MTTQSVGYFASALSKLTLHFICAVGRHVYRSKLLEASIFVWHFMQAAQNDLRTLRRAVN